MTRTFIEADGRYALAIPDFAISLEVDRLRRERQELIGELTVRCGLAGARTCGDGVLSVADFNLSSARARSERGRLLAARAETPDLDWEGYLEDLCQRVLVAERTGSPAVSLHDLPRPAAADDFAIDGIVLPRRHPSMVFGDGGTLKSYLLLRTLGLLAQRGEKVAYFDWELSGEDHRDRLERLFGPQMPLIRYVRCERPLVYEVDRLRRMRRDDAITYCGYDSVAFACDGPPEAAEVASVYFRAVRQIGNGSLHVAHMTKAETADQKPFGSIFWHNGARSTWYAKLVDEGRDEKAVGLLHRKSNLGPLCPAVALRLSFAQDRIVVTRINAADLDDLAPKLPMWQRVQASLRGGPLTIVALAKRLDAKPDTVEKTLKRYTGLFVRVTNDDGIFEWANLERRQGAA